MVRVKVALVILTFVKFIVRDWGLVIVDLGINDY